ncbi:hypothetical protein SDC9_137506 [bioreactor metagenome]|uniref:Uncharacterized protein n=1 Tax=bioreactor metagenome TaxID=1076179 RepID=A0A645DMA4_9ZZZZ
MYDNIMATPIFAIGGVPLGKSPVATVKKLISLKKTKISAVKYAISIN